MKLILKICTVYFMFLSFLNFYSCSSGKYKTDEEIETENWEKAGVKKINEYLVNYTLGIAAKEFLSQETDLDSKGKKLKTLSYKENSNIDYIVNYTYNTSQLLIQILCTDSVNNMVFRIEKTYDKNNFRLEHTYHLPDGSFKYKNIATCDDYGNVLRLKWYRPDGFKATHIFTFKNGLKIKEEELDADNKTTFVWTYTYTKNNLLSKAVQVYPGGKINSVKEYFYDVSNRLIKENFYSSFNLDKYYEYSYNPKNLPSEKAVYNGSGRLIQKYRYEYKYSK